MKKLVNPFKPTAGAEPPVLIGREKVLEDFSDALEEGVGAPSRLMRITGPRGSGKTVLLTELGDIARERGWSVVDETASEKLVSSLVAALGQRAASPEASVDFDLGVVKAHVGTGAVEDSSKLTLREAMGRATSRRTGNPMGLLVTIDEVQDAAESDMREIASAVQHLIRERKNVAFVFAGVTTGVMDLINGPALTFLRRAKAEELGAIPLDEVSVALRASIEKSGMRVSDAALDDMARATEGYAYLIQLVGYHVWRMARRHAGESLTITQEDSSEGVKEALRDFNVAVHETALADLPLKAVEYLLAMTCDDGVSSTAEIADRLQTSPSSLTSYRRMLVKRQIIEPTARGFVAFSIPYTREYLMESRDALLARYGC
ncbi:AAA family ATPase [Adlercreutzia sp. ZJ242]|uniref:AAA family ATPase n=1 Tax=Adlercreutzia sp. ZJ242 TaxID=2709409 RepID=UPI0013EB72FE|nr:ATP-binding protein [Adlercreutzia sp. ZJ242]